MNIGKKVQCAVLTSKSINLSQESLTKLIVQSLTYLHLISAEGKTSPPRLAWQAIATAQLTCHDGCDAVMPRFFIEPLVW